jgi:hypothetical protein
MRLQKTSKDFQTSSDFNAEVSAVPPSEEVVLFSNTSDYTHGLVEQKCTRMPYDVKVINFY